MTDPFPLTEIINYREISPLLGTSGQPEPDQFSAVKAAGYELVINLLPEISSSAIPEEPEMVADLGMEYISIPVIWDQPTPADLEQFFAALKANQGRKVFVHCAMNMRVSAFVFLYRVLAEGMPVEAAAVALHSVWEPNPVWQAFIEDRLAAATGR